MAKNDIKGQVALITGASRGIGRAIAEALAAEGCRLMLVARDESKLLALAETLKASGTEVATCKADLSQEPDLVHCIQATLEVFGGLHILINNAGLGIYGPIESFDPSDWDRVMNVNVRTPFRLCQQSIAPMRETGGGTIINIASVVGIKGYVNQGAYTASKHALMGMSKVLAQEVAEDGIRVHTLCPGGVNTDMVGDARPDLDRSILMAPEELAEIVVFLLTHRNNAVIDNLQIRRASGAPWF